MTFAAPFTLRRFGSQMTDLEADLGSPRPYAITSVLARCAQGTAEEAIWDLGVGQRIAALLALAAWGGAREFDVDWQCPQCGLANEVRFGVDELLEAGAGASCMVEVCDGQRIGRYRLPTGRDQRYWLAFSGEDEAALVRRMIEGLRIEGEAGLEAVEAALDQADPLIRPVVTAACSQCEKGAETEVDVAGKALEFLAREQRRLFASVHLLASRYHWSEAEIFALPEWRREQYIQLLGEED